MKDRCPKACCFSQILLYIKTGFSLDSYNCLCKKVICERSALRLPNDGWQSEETPAFFSFRGPRPLGWGRNLHVFSGLSSRSDDIHSLLTSWTIKMITKYQIKRPCCQNVYGACTAWRMENECVQKRPSAGHLCEAWIYIRGGM